MSGGHIRAVITHSRPHMPHCAADSQKDKDEPHEEPRATSLWPDLTLRDDARRLYELRSFNVTRISQKSLCIPGVTQVCHQCQHQCLVQQCSCSKSTCEHTKRVRKPTAGVVPVCKQVVCRWCLERHYGSTKFMEQPDGSLLCPPCRGVCNCGAHLGNTVSRAPPLTFCHSGTLIAAPIYLISALKLTVSLVLLDECTEGARRHSGIAAQLSSQCPYLTRWRAGAEHAEQAPTLPDAQEVECTMAALHLIFPSVQQCIAEWRKHAGISDLNKVCTLPR